jgi:simple sugar transport system ATP-binding protein
MTIAERVTVLRDGRNLGTYWVRDLDRSRLGELITGHVFESSLKAPFSSKVEPMLEVSGLTREGQYADVDLELRPGEIWASSGAWAQAAPSLPSHFLV